MNHNIVNKILYYYYKDIWKDKIFQVNNEINNPPYSNRLEMSYTLEYIQLWKDIIKFRNKYKLRGLIGCIDKEE